ncbi:MAG: DinB family protein [Anaerolineaceae bacterium]|nr:DinB family protein [Anaerolineaceae bacterium]
MSLTTIDFTPWFSNEKKLDEIGIGLTSEDLRNATNESIDYLLSLLDNLTDADIAFEPHDPNANDEHAVEGEEHIGWNMGHLIAHTTASSDEGAAISSLLARGVEEIKRPRYETPWRDMNTVESCVQRLEESRRMRLAYLETWPDSPHFENYRSGVSERFVEYFGNLNCIGAFLMGLSHEVGHYDQIIDARKQALAAREQA